MRIETYIQNVITAGSYYRSLIKCHFWKFSANCTITENILISPVWLSLLPEANSFSNAPGAFSKWTKKCVRVFMDSESDIHDKQIVAFLQHVHCNALWRHRNFLRFETYTYTKSLYETITYAIFICITLDELLNSHKWTQFILF